MNSHLKYFAKIAAIQVHNKEGSLFLACILFSKIGFLKSIIENKVLGLMLSSKENLVEFAILYKMHSHLKHLLQIHAIQVHFKEGSLFMSCIADFIF